MKLWIGAYSQRLRVRSHSVQFSMGVEFRASYSLDILERRHRDESWPSTVAASVAGIEFRPRFLLRTRSKSNSICESRLSPFVCNLRRKEKDFADSIINNNNNGKERYIIRDFKKLIII